jgi:hypothetical protein
VNPPIPETLEELLSPAWLSAALGRRFPGIEVTKVTRGTVVSRVSTNACFRIECAGGLPKGLSPDLCAKGYFGDFGTLARNTGLAESSFYRDIAEATGVRTLRSVFAGCDAATGLSVVITEDVIARGATFIDGRSAYSVDQLRQSLAELAKLHAGTWQRAEYARADWLATRFDSYTMYRGVPDIRFNFEGPIGARVPKQVRDAQRLFDRYVALGRELAKAEPWCVIHGDTHVGNLFLEADGSPALVDWQLVQRAPWYVDVGYHIASSLPVEERRKHERELLRHYLDRLAAGGAPAPSFDAAWRDIRRGILHGFYLWGITRVVDPSITTILLERLGNAAADHEVFASIR